MSTYLPEQFRQISSNFPGQFGQVGTYLPEWFWQITSLFWEINVNLSQLMVSDN